MNIEMLKTDIQEKIQECKNSIDELKDLYGEFEGVIYQQGLLYAYQDILKTISTSSK